MIKVLDSGLRVLNIDESWISETDYSRRMWYPSTGAGTVTEKQINPRLALIAALDSDGNTFFSLTHAITNSDIMLLFLSNLARTLDREQYNWRDNTIILLDGARYHFCLGDVLMLGYYVK